MEYQTSYEEDVICENDQVTLLGYLDMQTNFLKTLIESELELPCRVQVFEVGSSNRVELESGLILIDCKHVPVEEIGNFIHGVSQDFPDQRVALINLRATDNYEKLVQWPQVKGIFYETVEQDNLLEGMKSLMAGGDWLPRNVMQRLIDEFRSAPRMRAQSISLTRRERQILKLLLDGATNLEIANALGLSEYTIKSHLYNVFKKINVKNRIQAYNWAQMNLPE